MLADARYLELLDTERAALADRARGSLDRPVPSCPDWDVAQLCAHTAAVFGFVEATRAAGADDAPVRVPAPEPDAGVVDALVRAGDAVSTGLRDGDRADPVWSWTDDRTVGFWRRRLAHETIIHRVDAELALGLEPRSVDPEVAADSIDEWLTTYVLGRERWRALGRPGATLHLHCTDTDGEWMLHVEADGASVTREHGKGDVAARGAAWLLQLACYGRATLDDLEVFGDVDLLAALLDEPT